MSLYIGKNGSGKAFLHITSTHEAEADMLVSSPSTVLNTADFYSTAKVFEGSVVASEDGYMDGVDTTVVLGKFHTVDLGTEFGPYMNTTAGKRKIYSLLDRENIVHHWGYGRKYTDTSGVDYTSSYTDNGHSGYNCGYRFYSTINLDGEEVYPSTNSRYIRFLSDIDNLTEATIVVSNSFTDGTVDVSTDDYTTLKVNSEGIWFDETTNLLSINYVITPPINLEDYIFNVGSTQFQVLNSGIHNNNFTLESSPVIKLLDGPKLLFSSEHPILRAFSNKRQYTILKDSITFSGTSTTSIFTGVASPYVSITLDHEIGEDFDDSILLYDGGPTVWFYFFYYTSYTNTIGGQATWFKLSLGFKLLSSTVSLVSYMEKSHSEFNVALKTMRIDLLLME